MPGHYVVFEAVSPVKLQRRAQAWGLGLGLEDRKGREMVRSSMYRFDPPVVDRLPSNVLTFHRIGIRNCATLYALHSKITGNYTKIYT